MQKVILNPGSGGSNTGSISGNLIEKNYNLEIAKEIYNQLKNLGIDVYLTRDSDVSLSDQERLSIVNDIIKEGDNAILVTNILSSGNDSGAEIIYALKDSDNLANQISNNLESTGVEVIKYYQLRNPSDSSTDFYEIIREAFNTESLIISLGYVDNSFDNSFLTNNKEMLATAISEAIYNYIKKENIYVVQKGDNLYNIALKFKTTVNDIKELNNLTSNALTIGQNLLIPKEKTETSPSEDDMFMNYTVLPGDSLYSIARKYNITGNIIKEINKLSSNTLSVGQILKIPNTALEKETGDYSIYTVKSGDSLYKLANQFDTSVNEIKNLNGLTTDALSIGQTLKIPANTSQQETDFINYTVKSGDSLYKLANLYQTTVNSIKSLNHLTSNLLSIGQILKIPKK